MKFTLLETNSNHGLTPKNLKKIMLIAKLIDILILKTMRINCIGLFIAIQLGFSAMAYIKQEFTIYLISIIIWFLILSFWAIKVTAIIIFIDSMLFFNIYYLRLRYKQFYDFEIKRYNFQQQLYQHTKLATMTEQSNQLFKYIMAENYFISTTLVLTNIITFLYGNGILLFRLACLIVGCFGFFLLFLMTLFSAQLSQEAHRFYKIVYSYITVTKLGLKIKLKVII